MHASVFEGQMNRRKGATDPPMLLRAEEAAGLLSIGRSKMFELMASGAIPGVVRIGRSVRISREALERWVRDQACEEAGHKAA